MRRDEEFSGAWNQWMVVTMQEKSMWQLKTAWRGNDNDNSDNDDNWNHDDNNDSNYDNYNDVQPVEDGLAW